MTATAQRIPAPIVSAFDGHATTTSKDVADYFRKRHSDVVRAIKNLLADLAPRYQRNFALIQIAIDLGDDRTRQDPAYRLTFDGFILLVMGFTGKKALACKLAYIDAFNEMRARLLPNSETPAHLSPAEKQKRHAPLRSQNPQGNCDLTIGNFTIREDSRLFSLSDLHEASGGAAKHKPTRFLRLAKTQSLIDEIRARPEATHPPFIRINDSADSAADKSTYVCRELAIAYASWAGTPFYLSVTHAILDYHAPRALTRHASPDALAHIGLTALRALSGDGSLTSLAVLLKQYAHLFDTKTLFNIMVLATEHLEERLQQPSADTAHLHGADPEAIGRLIQKIVQKNTLCHIGTVIQISQSCTDRLNRSVQHLEIKANHYQSEFERLDAIINPQPQTPARRTKA